ncbi:unnamed protein product [Blumeria hordei]|nr:unnamed protein product [Blumeria hordei]
MPHWGRQPGVKSIKSHGQREKGVGYEIESDSTDEEEMSILATRSHSTGRATLSGDNLSHYRSGKNKIRGPDDSIETSDSCISLAQLTSRERPSSHLQSALSRIRRAQEKGKNDVKLSKEELSALELRRRQLQNTARSKDYQESESEDEQSRTIAVPLSSAIISDQSAMGYQRRDKLRNSGGSESKPASSSHSSSKIIKGPDGKLYAPLESLNQLQTTQRSFAPCVNDTSSSFNDQAGFKRNTSDDARQTFSNGSYSSKYDRSPISSTYPSHSDDPFNHSTSSNASVNLTHRSAPQTTLGSPDIPFSPFLRSHTSSYHNDTTDIKKKHVKGRETEESFVNDFDYAKEEIGQSSEQEFAMTQTSQGTPPTRRSTRKRRPVKGYS